MALEINRRITTKELVRRLGGADLLRAHFPELYKAYLFSLEHENIVNFDEVTSAGDIFGTQDSYKVRTLNYTPDSTLSTASSIEVAIARPTLAIIGSVTDMETGKELDGFSVYDNNCRQLLGECKLTASTIGGGSSRQYSAKSTFSALSMIRERYCLSGFESQIIAPKIIDTKSIVKSMNVTAPMPIKHTSADRTLVCYNRSWGGADYDYVNVRYDSKSIDVWMPVSGSAEFADGFQPSSTDPIDKEQLILQLEHIGKSCAVFNPSYLSGLQFTVVGNTLTWKFPDEWHDIIDKTNIGSGTILGFYMKLVVRLANGLMIPLIVQSEGEEHDDPSYKKIPQIKICWGCFGKYTQILMADGSKRYVGDLKIGDIVQTKDEGNQKIKNVIKGHEEQLITIVNSFNSKICVSETHPILTTEGFVKAVELTAGSILVTPNGTATVEGLYYEEYNDSVYGIELECSSALIANDFLRRRFCNAKSE